MKIKCCSAALLVMLPLLAKADGYSGPFKIVEHNLQQNASGDWNMWIKPDVVLTSTSCTNNSYYVVPMANDPYSNQRYATFLTAFVAGKTVEIYMSGCYSSGGQTYPLVDKSRLKLTE
jgi:hypothetical protein